LLYSSDSDFRRISYECYAKLVGRNPYLKDDTEMLFRFIKDHHRIKSESMFGNEFPAIQEDIDKWIEKTWRINKVNLYNFASDWVSYFYDNKDLWPVTHRKKTDCLGIKHEYDYKQKSNLFNLNQLYVKMPKTPYTKGKKRYFEVLLMYCWLSEIVGDEDDYWQVYIEKVSASL